MNNAPNSSGWLAMPTKYSVFISSTYLDLREERAVVLRATLELGQIPMGMELFPAADADSWRLVQTAIDDSDYYLIIVAGRYGSIDSERVSFTEREYDYALSQGKPVLALLHSAPERLPRDQTDVSQEAWEQLMNFRKKIKAQRNCAHWTDIHDLKSQAFAALSAAMRDHPSTGWMRGSATRPIVTLASREAMYKKVSDLLAGAEIAVADTTWGADAPTPIPAAARERERYIDEQSDLAIREHIRYRELFSDSPGKAERRANAMHRQTKSNGAYRARVIGDAPNSPPLIDFCVIDRRHVILSHVRSERDEGHRFVYIDDVELAHFLQEWFDEIWAVARPIAPEAQERG